MLIRNLNSLQLLLIVLFFTNVTSTHPGPVIENGEIRRPASKKTAGEAGRSILKTQKSYMISRSFNPSGVATSKRTLRILLIMLARIQSLFLFFLADPQRNDEVHKLEDHRS